MASDCQYRLRYALHNVHAAPITSIKLSPSGQHFATCSADSTIKIYHTATGRFRTKFRGHYRGVSDICWSPDSQYLALALDDNTIKLWSLRQPGRGSSAIKTFKGHSYCVTCVRFNAKGNLLISGSADEAIRIWDVQRGRCLKTLSAHSDPIASVDITWDGTVLASGSYDGLIRLFDVFSGQCLKTLMYEKADSSFPISYVKFSPNGKYLLSSSLDGIIRLWDYTNNKVVKTYKGCYSKIMGENKANIKENGEEKEIESSISTEDNNNENTNTTSKGLNGSIAEKYCLGTEFITATSSPMIASGTESGHILMFNLESKEITTVLQTNQNSPVLQVDIGNSEGEVLVSATMNGHVQVWDLQQQQQKQQQKQEEVSNNDNNNDTDEGDGANGVKDDNVDKKESVELEANGNGNEKKDDSDLVIGDSEKQNG